MLVPACFVEVIPFTSCFSFKHIEERHPFLDLHIERQLLVKVAEELELISLEAAQPELVQEQELTLPFMAVYSLLGLLSSIKESMVQLKQEQDFFRLVLVFKLAVYFEFKFILSSPIQQQEVLL